MKPIAILRNWLMLAGLAWILAGCSDVAAYLIPPSPPPTPTPIVIVVTPTPLPIDDSADLDLAERRIVDVYQRVSPAVVNITTQVLRSNFFYGVIPEEGSGSGFVYDRQGHIITNYHVVENANEITVSFGQDLEIPAQVIGVDPPNDLAVLQVDSLPPNANPILLGESDDLQVGQRAIAIGNPFGQFERTLTVGVVSAVNRTLEVDTDRVLRGVIQTDAAINRGNSGGPLLDSSGRLIGVNTAIVSPSGASAGVGLAIPASKVRRVIPILIENGHYPHPWLGIEGLGYALYPELAQTLNLPVEQGLLIARVYRDSPAQQSGIHTASKEVIYGRRRLLVGGDVLTAIDGIDLQSWEDLDAYLQEQTEVGQEVTLTLWREGQSLDLPITLAEEPM